MAVMEPAQHTSLSSHMRARLRDDVCRGRTKPALQVNRMREGGCFVPATQACYDILHLLVHRLGKLNMRKSPGCCRKTPALQLGNSPDTLRSEVNVSVEGIIFLHLLHVGRVPMTCSCAMVVTGLKVEDWELKVEDGNGSQAWVPLRIISKASASGRLPSVIFLHATGAAPLYMMSIKRCVPLTLRS